MSMGYIVYREDLANEAEVQSAVDDNPTMYPMGTAIQTEDGNAWLVVFNDGVTVTLDQLNSGTGTSIWVRDGENTYMNTPESWEVEIGGITYLWGNITELQINEDLSVQNNINTKGVYRMQDNEVMRYDAGAGTDGDDLLVFSTRAFPDRLYLHQDKVGINVIPTQWQLHIDGSVYLENVNKTRIQFAAGLDSPDQPPTLLEISADETGDISTVENWLGRFEILSHDNKLVLDAKTEIQFAIGGTGGITPNEVAKIHADGGVTIGSPTGGSMGAGTLNAENGVFVNGVALT